MRRLIMLGLAILLGTGMSHQEAAAQQAQNPLERRTADAGEVGIYCARLFDVRSQGDCDNANTTVDNMPMGIGRLAPPNPVFRDNPVEVNFEVSRPDARSALLEDIAVREYQRVPLSRYMSAVLVGDGFRVVPAPTSGGQNGPQREFGLLDSMTWRWNVTALDAPHHSLRINVFVHIPVKNKDGGGRDVISPVLSRSINIPVRTTYAQKFHDIGRWLDRTTTGVKLLTGLLVALGALLTAWFSLPGLRRRLRKRPSHQPRARRSLASGPELQIAGRVPAAIPPRGRRTRVLSRPASRSRGNDHNPPNS